MPSQSRTSIINILTNVIAVIAIILLIFYIIYAILKFTTKEEYIEDDPKIQELYNAIKPLFEKPHKPFTGRLKSLNSFNILKHISMKKANKSYTINKEVIHMCLKDEHGNYYSQNTLLLVLLHEIAHIINRTVGHDLNFQETYKELLEYASQKGIVDIKIPVPPTYCSISPPSPPS
jgi:ABC-type cobalt transport system substrate-binding protein